MSDLQFTFKEILQNTTDALDWFSPSDVRSVYSGVSEQVDRANGFIRELDLSNDLGSLSKLDRIENLDLEVEGLRADLVNTRRKAERILRNLKH